MIARSICSWTIDPGPLRRTSTGGPFAMIQQRGIRRSSIISFACLTALLVAPFSAYVRGQEKLAGFSPEKLEQIPAFLKSAIDKKQAAGASALIARQGKVVHVWTAGMQDIEEKTPVSESTIFRIASMSKPITSVAVMILVQDGKLQVTD